VSFPPVYLDASALLKLVVVERESGPLRTALDQWPDRISASIVRVEVHRALRRLGRPHSALALAETLLDSLVLVHLDAPVLARAAALKNPLLRALDAIHVASALSIGDDPEAFVTYDGRLARAASAEGLTVLHPGIDRLR
jgi:predicted nucleic acid-binding protein